MAGVKIEFPLTGEGFTLDIAESMIPTRSADVVSNEIEDGSEITDHRNKKPRTLEITGFVSDVPIYSHPVEKYDVENSIGDHVKIRERLERADEMDEILNIDIGKARGTYESYLITNLSFPWIPETGNGLQISLSLQQVRIAKPKTRNLTAERAIQQNFSLGADLGLAGISAADSLLSGATNGVTGLATLVNSQETMSRMSAGRGLGRLTGVTGGGHASSVAISAATPTGVPAEITDFVAGF